MARPLRYEGAGAVYHVMARGDGGKDVFEEDKDRFDVILANPPFGKKSSTMIVGEDGRTSSEKDIIERDDFWATTSNKQLNFVQHVRSILEQHGRAAVVVPDNVLFEGGAGGVYRAVAEEVPHVLQRRAPQVLHRTDDAPRVGMIGRPGVFGAQPGANHRHHPEAG